MPENFMNNISQQIGTYLPGILTAVAVLIIGWILAHIISRIVKAGLTKSGLGDKLGRMISPDGSIDASSILQKVTFYGIMLFVLITFFNVLNLPVVSEPLNAFLSKIFAFAPRILSAVVLGVVAYVLARVGRDLSRKGLEAADLDSRLSSLGGDAGAVVSTLGRAADEGLSAPLDDVEEEFNINEDSAIASTARPIDAAADEDGASLSQTIPDAIYWIVFALFLPAILGALQIPGLLEPVQSMFTKAFNFLPNIIGAAVILLVGIFVAKIVRQVASNLTASLGINSLASRFGVGDAMSGRKISDLLGMVVYALILLPVMVAALNTLSIEAITKPASNILNQLTSLIPGFLGAGIVLGLAWFVGKIVSDLVSDLLAGVGFDSIPQKIGLNLSSASPNASPSKLCGKLVLVSIVLLSAMQALPMMGLDSFAGHLETFAGFAVRVLVGLAIVALGMYLANLVAGLVRDSGVEGANKLALIARIAILVFAGGFGLQHMGLSASIVNVAFGSLLGGLGLAAAIAFGWGGKDAAKRILDRMVD